MLDSNFVPQYRTEHQVGQGNKGSELVVKGRGLVLGRESARGVGNLDTLQKNARNQLILHLERRMNIGGQIMWMMFQ